MDELFEFLSDKAAVTTVFIIVIAISALIVIFINPMRDKFYSHRYYDKMFNPQEDNPWDEMLGEKPNKKGKKKK